MSVGEGPHRLAAAALLLACGATDDEVEPVLRYLADKFGDAAPTASETIAQVREAIAAVRNQP